MILKTAEFVTPKHPDKICDFIADSILDAYLTTDPNSRVAVEVMGGHGQITVSGEVTSHGNINLEKIVQEIVGSNFKVNINVVPQSSSIAHGVDAGGAGDQGIMVGFACRETANFMPMEYELARNLCREVYKVYPFDGKVQVTVRGGEVGSGKSEWSVKSVVASFQNSKTQELLNLVQAKIQADEYLINPAGEWSVGGFDADSGLSGRKIVVDNYGPNIPVGGGSFSGKDPTKVDRSAAYIARRIAVDLLQEKHAQEVLVKLAYAIGKSEPIMRTILVDHEVAAFPTQYDLTPTGIRKILNLNQPIYVETANWGHFGRGFVWG